MTRHAVLAAALAAGLAWAGAAAAQSLADVDGPAEVPPASFKGTQYVDSDGCVFVRADMGGKVTWVPRVGRDRKLICGQVPSLGGAAVAAAPAAPEPVAVPEAPAEERTAAAEPARTVAAAAPKAAAPAAKVRKAGARSGGYAAKPPVVALRRDATPSGEVFIVSVETVPGDATPCANAPRVAQRYVLSDGRRILRCGGPVRDPVRYLNAAGISGLRVAGAPPRAAAPAGYVPAWDDDRLNPNRGPRTAAGNAAMAAKWTDGVPMKARGPISGTAPSAMPAAASGGSFIQVGIFGEAANAERAVARLQALGLPAARSASTLRGRAVTMVMAGPFDAAGARAALASVRSGGFPDAYIR